MTCTYHLSLFDPDQLFAFVNIICIIYEGASDTEL